MTVTLTYLGDSACEARDSRAPKASPVSVRFEPGKPVEMDMTNAFHRHLVEKASGNRFFQVEGDEEAPRKAPLPKASEWPDTIKVSEDEAMELLREEAKAAGVKSAHLFKDPAKLRDKIAEAVSADA